ncbi:MAG: sulfotransferase [Limnoraphis sp.]
MSPVFIVGMPRSGSTLFTRLLNESQDLFLVNDSYYLQYVESVNGFENNHPSLNNDLAQYVLKSIQARIERPDSPPIECGLMFSESEEHQLEDYALKCGKQTDLNWASILKQIMEFAANQMGKKIWGHNTPQDYLHIDKLLHEFPDAKFMFMMRDPRSVVRSYKYVSSNGYHDTNRYHPVLQSMAWQASIRTYKTWKDLKPEQFLLVLYEELIEKTNETLAKVGDFTGAKFPYIDLNNFGNNSSFQGKNKRSLTDTEIWLCEKVVSQEMLNLGYSLSEKKPRLQDLGQILDISQKVAWFYLKQSFTSKDMRNRVLNVAGKVLNPSR